ncbi:hypothetical protein J1G18_13630 [Pseudomonas sp. MIS38]|uniref:hypothetical protein n=1 Tax=Pseudomonas sp. MIS38 TaxID=91465 RepID=UPI001CA6449B|nr:hypothetical protein [Pseudomonas sp. MIS38]MBY8958329.1 hypothetical protein [Pseudomonas sp. MIS38]
MSGIQTLATLVLGGAFDATELGENDIQPDSKLIEELQQRLVTSSHDVCVELVDRAELERVTAERNALQLLLTKRDERIDELERYKMSIWPSEDTLIAAGLGYPIGKEQAVKIYKAALKARTDTPENADCEWCYGVGHDYYGDPCCGCCRPDQEALARLVAENASRTSIVLPADQPAGKFYKSQKLRRGFRDGWSACLHTVKALNHSL